ncbi:MAG TPA: cytochrome P450 [Pseudolysinimonas sp.]|nr:cytochrome P450 [Pseudolysinimonas sp.]
MSEPVVLDEVKLEELERDPYPSYAEWRRDAPVAYLPLMNGWMITRWDDCEFVGKDESRIDTENEFNDKYFGRSITTMKGEPHRFLREAVDTPLRPRSVKRYIETLARPVARRYVQRIASLGEIDATTDLLELMSVRVIGEVLGLGDRDDETLQRWFHNLSLGLANLAGDPETQQIADTTVKEIDSHIADAIERLTAHPDETGLSHLIHTSTPDGRPRTFDELIGTIRVIIMGGFQEPGHGTAASLLGLLQTPEYARAVREAPSLIPASVHEGLRWIAPFALSQRRAAVDITLHDAVIPAGDEINLVIGSANRDERRYENPEKFDLFRERLPLASFGYGTHFCAGHFLAREFSKVTLEEMFIGLPGLRLDPEKEPVVSGFGMRAVNHLPVVWDAP